MAVVMSVSPSQGWWETNPHMAKQHVHHWCPAPNFYPLWLSYLSIRVICLAWSGWTWMSAYFPFLPCEAAAQSQNRVTIGKQVCHSQHPHRIIRTTGIWLSNYVQYSGWISTLAAQWNQLRSFYKCWRFGPILDKWEPNLCKLSLFINISNILLVIPICSQGWELPG